MSQLYPLRFEPILRRYIWGGRRLGTELAKPLGDGDDYAESWEVVDHGPDQSVVSAGPLRGRTLSDLLTSHGPALLGRHHPRDRFPLLFKFLDCHRNLSVQVHPNDRQAAGQAPPDLGKTEAWVVLHAEPGSRIWAGLKRGFDRAAFEREVRRGTTELCLHALEPRAGDCIFIPAGTVHALGAGLLVAEIQQASDTTFRLYDWNRVGKDGQPRPLHVEQALETIDYTAEPVEPQAVRPLEAPDNKQPATERLVACDKFVLDRHGARTPMAVGGDERFHILSVIEGRCTLQSSVAPVELGRGATVLVPACEPPVTLAPHPHAVVLDMYLP